MKVKARNRMVRQIAVKQSWQLYKLGGFIQYNTDKLYDNSADRQLMYW